MRSHWRNIEDKQFEKAIVSRAYSPEEGSISALMWVGLGLTLCVLYSTPSVTLRTGSVATSISAQSFAPSFLTTKTLTVPLTPRQDSQSKVLSMRRCSMRVPASSLWMGEERPKYFLGASGRYHHLDLMESDKIRRPP